MNQTNTDASLETLAGDAERDVRRRRWTWAAGALVAAAGIIAAIVFAPHLGSDRPAPAAPSPPAPEGVATAFVEGYGSFDWDRAASHLADDADLSIWPDASGGDSWPRAIGWSEAVGFRLHLDSCQPQGSSSAGTEVWCAFGFHALGSEALGRGPFPENVLKLTVQDGEIAAARMSLAYTTNGFSAQMWEPFAGWVAQAYPKDAALMYADWPSLNQQALTQQSLNLWEKHIRDYTQAVNQGTAQ